MRRPSPSLVISVVALVFSMSGTAYAATGGTFVLGRANTEGSAASLSNTHGTALNLSSATGKPPLTVNRTVQIPRLNASELQGVSASGFVHGTGHAGSKRVTISGAGATALALTTGSALIGQCDNGGAGADLYLSLGLGASATWWNNAGVASSATSGFITALSPKVFMVTAQVAEGSAISTYMAAQTYNAGADACTFTVQLMTTGS
ncbi:MAG TPA: hypothetical protein VHZ33_16300 [Trebonia sp.]|jgi:hypothetical protein|nr:hypothetical protein [Trebonia sp.]